MTWGANNVRWSVGYAEDVDAEPASFELITAGNAFHRLDQPLVAGRVWSSRNGRDTRAGWVNPRPRTPPTLPVRPTKAS